MEEEMNIIQHQVAEEEAITAQLQEEEHFLRDEIARADRRLHIIREKRKLEHLKNTTKRIRLNINILWDTLREKEITIDRECRLLAHVCTTYFIYQYIIIILFSYANIFLGFYKCHDLYIHIYCV